MTTPKAVHFGAGNIGRGFVGLLLHEAGNELVFADVAAELIDSLKEQGSYTVHAVGTSPTDTVVSGFRAVNSATETEALTAEIASAQIVTTAVGAHILPLIAGSIAEGIAARPAGSERVAVMACENAINATDILEAAVREKYEGEDLDEKALFANTAVDRIVPVQAPDAGLDVSVETFFEWVVDRTPFAGTEPEIPGVTWVDDLAPYIERKLFTVNTGHATTAWHGWRAGHATIADAIEDPAVEAKVREVLAETSELLIAKHGFDAQTQQDYATKVLGRFHNRALPDPVERVGRAPLRKLSRHDRIVGPAAALAERDMAAQGLLDSFAAALAFTPEGDEEADRLQEILRTQDADGATAEVTGLEPEHPLYSQVKERIAERQSVL